jgi:hypothetical protein
MRQLEFKLAKHVSGNVPGSFTEASCSDTGSLGTSAVNAARFQDDTMCKHTSGLTGHEEMHQFAFVIARHSAAWACHHPQMPSPTDGVPDSRPHSGDSVRLSMLVHAQEICIGNEAVGVSSSSSRVLVMYPVLLRKQAAQIQVAWVLALQSLLV